MKVTDRNTLAPERPKKRPVKKSLSKEEIREMVEARKKKKDTPKIDENIKPREPRSPKNIEALKSALQDGTISFSPKERAILEKLINP